MRIAVTYENGQIFQHFGHTAQFKLYDVVDGKITSTHVVDTLGSGHGALTHEQHQYDDGDHIGDHGDQLHVDARGAAQHDLEAGAEAEEQAADECAVGLELAEDNRCNRDKALTYNNTWAELIYRCECNESSTKTS